MTILSTNQPWPQVEVSVYDSSMGIFGGYRREIIDKPVREMVVHGMDDFAYDNRKKPTTLFVGQRALCKIKDLIAENSYLMAEITTKFFDGSLRDERKFLGMELILTVDDGLWIA